MTPRNRITRRIEALIYGDDAAVNPGLRAALFALSLCYGALVRLRAASYRRGLLKTRKLPCKVVAVGNITVGGTGKTPLTMAVTEMLRRMGLTVVVLSRGYKGTAEQSGGIVSDGRQLLMDARRAGDEPLMMAGHLRELQVPVVVGRDRFKIGLAAIRRFRPDVIVADDAFQHLGLARDVNLLLADSRGFGANAHLLPRGPLREPMPAIARSDALILSRSSGRHPAPLPPELSRPAGTRPVFQVVPVPRLVRWIPAHPRARPQPLPGADALAALPVFGFCGIAGNERFKRTLRQLDCDVRGFAGYADHHAYTDQDLETILDAARRVKADYLVTTEKDWVRIRDKMPLSLALVVLGVELDFGPDADAFAGYMKEKLGAAETAQLTAESRRD
jgi:tetraacyldisaccharide 4'-kinase